MCKRWALRDRCLGILCGWMDCEVLTNRNDAELSSSGFLPAKNTVANANDAHIPHFRWLGDICESVVATATTLGPSSMITVRGDPSALIPNGPCSSSSACDWLLCKREIWNSLFFHMLVPNAKWLTTVERLPYNRRVDDSVHSFEQLLHVGYDVYDVVEHFELCQPLAAHCGCVISWNVCHLFGVYCG